MEARLAQIEIDLVSLGTQHARRVRAIREVLERLVANPELLDKVLIKLSVDMADRLFVIAAEVYLLSQEAAAEETLP